MKKIIGVMPLWDDEKESLWMLPGYFGGIAQAGGLPIMFPLDAENAEVEQLCKMCDGFLLTGGHDVNPAYYGEEPLSGLVSCCEWRDRLEKQVLEYAMKNDRPVLGICRGIQFLNVMLGGTLYQDLPLQHPSAIEHHMAPPYDRACHNVRIERDSKLFRILGAETLGVNSYHHQAIRELAPGLQAMAVSDDGIIEAVSLENSGFLLAVQWHPELSYKSDENSRKIFRAFLEHC